MEVKNNLLYVDGKQVAYKPSPNHGGAKKAIRYIIIHYTGAATASSAIGWMLDPTAKVSAEIHLDREGIPVQLVPFNITAWHAGKSEWKGLVGLNSYSIGIELQNTGSQEYTKPQLDALVKICRALMASYPIEDILGHSDIAPGRKVDPGKQFPMTWLKEQLGLIGVPVEKPKVFNFYKTTSDLNFRVGPSTNDRVIQVIPKGVQVEEVNVKGDWSCILYKGLVGYVSSKYLTK